MTQTVVPFLDLAAQHRAIKNELQAVASSAFDTAGFIGGQRVAAFEAEFAQFTGARHCVGVGSGTDALALALAALGVGPGDTVVTVPNTFIATTEAVSLRGARFAFVDIDPHTCLMDPNRLEQYLKSGARRPKAVIPVHLYGQCADVDSIAALAGKYEFLILEDAAQAHGATHNGRNAGTLGQAAAFSFYPGKNLGACGEAGGVTTSDSGVADTIRMLRDHGQHVKYHHSLEGTNARLDAIQAGCLSVKLPLLAGWNARRREIAASYDAAFSSLDMIRPVTVSPGNTPVYHLYVVHTPDREGLKDHLAQKGIQTGLHYPVPLHLQPCYAKLGYAQGDFPATERSASTLLSLPIFPEMNQSQVGAVIEAVTEFARSAK